MVPAVAWIGERESSSESVSPGSGFCFDQGEMSDETQRIRDRGRAEARGNLRISFVAVREEGGGEREEE